MTDDANLLDERLRQNLTQVQKRIAAAAEQSGRDPTSIRLIAVTKYVDANVARALVNAGCTDLAESRPQELCHKAEVLSDMPIRWHLVGHLQRNKVARTLPYVSLLHSADSLRLLESINSAAAQLGRKQTVLLEVNISGDPKKTGLSPKEVSRLLPQVTELDHVNVCGLMAMAGREDDLPSARRDFAALHQLRDVLRRECAVNVTLDELSMGMSGDFEVAIEEGATIVRVGSALFEGFTP